MNKFSRRDVLKYATLAGGVSSVGFGSFMASAGSSFAAERKLGGSLRVAIAGSGAADNINAQGVVASGMDAARQRALFSPLWGPTPEGGMIPMLAETAEPNAKADEWTVQLRAGVEFHNGKPLTADDLIFSIKRILDPQVAAPGASYLAHIDPDGMTKLDDRTVLFKLKYPFAPFKASMMDLILIVPEGYDASNPIGTGPFKFKSFTPGEQSVFVRFENYWGEGPYVDELVLINIDDDTARVNALLAGQVDAIASVPFGQMPVIEASGIADLLVSETGALRLFTMRVDVEPFSDPRVREAIRLVADRKQLIDVAFSGQGRIGNDITSPFDPCYNSELPQRSVDIERAKQLLKEAGKENLTVELVTTGVQAGLVEMSQVLAEQARAAGITIDIRKVDPGTFYGPDYLKWPFAVDWYPALPYLKQVGSSLSATAPFNETHFNDEEYDALFSEALGTVDDNARCEIVHQMQQIEYDRGGYLIFGFPNIVDAYAHTVTGFVPHRFGQPLSYFEFERISFV